MDLKIQEFINSQEKERQSILSGIHAIILQKDKTVVPVVEPMMGKEMIIYKAKGFMKYGLAGVKKYMSLHLLPMYMSPALYPKFKALLPNANFQKGCINFQNKDEMPLSTVKQLITDCAKIDLLKIREEQLKARKAKK